jgi:hypothetical protein
VTGVLAQVTVLHPNLDTWLDAGESWQQVIHHLFGGGRHPVPTGGQFRPPIAIAVIVLGTGIELERDEVAVVGQSHSPTIGRK